MAVTREAITAAIFEQESGSGRADTSQANYAGARGPMQVTKGTFEGMKSKGLIPKDYDHANPAHTKDAGEKLVGFLHTKYNGDASKVSAAYYAGEKAVRADGTIADFRDLKNPKAPTTLQYVASVVGRLGKTTPQAATQAPPVQEVDPNTSVLASWEKGMPAPFEKTTQTAAGAQPSMVTVPGSPELPLNPVSEAARVAGIVAAQQADTQLRKDTSFLDKARAAFVQNGLSGAGMRRRAMSQFEEQLTPTPGYEVPKEALVGSEADQEFLQTAVNADHLARIKDEIALRYEQLATINRSGVGVGIAASLFAGLPEGYLTGLGSFRALQLARVGSGQLAAQGAKGAALASSVAENVGSNLALTALQDKFDPYVGASDYGMALAGGIIGSALSAPSIFSAADGAAAKAVGQRLADASSQEIVQLRQRAVQNLGEDASSERLQGEVKRLESDRVTQDISAGNSELPPTRRWQVDPEEEAERIIQRIKQRQLDADNAEGVRRFDAQTAEEQARRRGPAIKEEDPGVVGPDVQEIREETIVIPKKPEVPVVERRSPDWAMDPPQRRAIKSGQPTTKEVPTLSGRALLLETASKTKDPMLKAVAERLAGQLIDDVAVYRVSDTVVKQRYARYGWDQSSARAHYDPNSHSVMLPISEKREMVIVHEVAHAATVLKMMYGRDNPTTAHGRLTTQIDQLLQLSREQWEANKAIGRVDPQNRYLVEYYLSNRDEFTAGLYSGKSGFTDFLQSIKLPGDNESTILGKLADLVRKILGLSDKETNVLLKSLDLADELVATPLNVSYVTSLRVEGSGSLSIRLAPEDLDGRAAIVNDPIAQKYGLGLLPMETPAQQAEVVALLDMYKKAEAKMYNVDEKRLSSLMDTAVFKGAQSTANTLARSKNPVARMLAAELLENPSGSTGRRSTASLAKYLNERTYLGNTLNEFQGAYTTFRKSQGVPVTEDFFGGRTWEHFNRLVAEEIEARRSGHPVQSNELVRTAADSLEKSYERMRNAQTTAKTVGWGALPETSKGYMPHKLSPEKVRNATQSQLKALHSALTDQFVQIEGFDLSFSDALASKYIDRVHRRALGGFDSAVGAHHVGAADIVEDALEAMGMTRMQIREMMGKYMKGAAGHTKKRLDLDLLAEHGTETGSFRLMDLFETDQFSLVRSQAHRVSGEVALARHGIMGKAGLKLARRALEFGGDNSKATSQEMEAFDQIAAEFMGEPFGTQSKLVDRVMQVNSLSRLGGMGFTQFAEAINGIFHVGALKALNSITSMPRLRSEIKALARGEKVDNPILGSLERFGGAEFGTDAYKTVFPFDNPSLDYHTYGKDTVNAADRLLRGGAYVQGKLSMWRAIHSTQQRGMAEQVVRKAAQFLRDGTNDAALRDMGIDDDLMGRLRKDLDTIAEFENGKLTNFDITKATDLDAARDFTQSVHRGVSQIIQGTFIGETGKWSHDGMMRLLTQFRTFSLTSVEKQWARQYGNVGMGWAVGMLLGAISMAAPVYMARTYLASAGREDREEYLEKQISVAQVARASLNYIAMSGLAGDFLDATTALTGMGEMTGGRSGASSRFVGNMVAPSLGLADDVWKALQNTKEGTDPHELVKVLPFSRLPFLIPAINSLGE